MKEVIERSLEEELDLSSEKDEEAFFTATENIKIELQTIKHRYSEEGSQFVDIALLEETLALF